MKQGAFFNVENMSISIKLDQNRILCEDIRDLEAQLLSLADATSEPLALTVCFDAGSYALKEPFTLSAKTAPALKNLRITLKAEEKEQAEFHSLSPISPSGFKRVEGKPYYVYQFPKNENGTYPVFRDLYANGTRLKLSESEMYKNPFDLTPEQRRGEEELEGLYAPYDLATRIKAGSETNVQLFMYVLHEYVALRVKEIDLSSVKEKDGEKYALITFIPDEFKKCYIHGVHWQNKTVDRQTFFRNTSACLTEGSFAYLHDEGLLYVYPSDDTDMENTTFFYPTLEKLFEFDGLTGTTIKNLSFTGVSSQYLCYNSFRAPMSNVHRGKQRHSAVLANDMRDTVIDGCLFRHIGCNGIQFTGKTVTLDILNSKFIDVGGFGIAVGGYDGGTWNLPDPTSAPDEKIQQFFKTATYNVRVENNYLEHIGYDFPTCNAIYFGSVDGGKILHNTVIGCTYSCISLGWGWRAYFVPGELFNLRDVEIAYNRLHNFMDVMRDGGAIYTYGANSISSYIRRFNSTHHNYISLDDAGDFNKRGYYLDCGTSNWDVYDNIADNCIFPLFAQFHVKHEYGYHLRLDRTYSTTPIDKGNHAPERDVLLGEVFVEKGGMEALLAKYPEAKAICDGAGCRLCE